MEYFAAGGAVRDLLLGRTPRDVDYVFHAMESAFIQRNPQARKSKSGTFPVYLLSGQEYSPLPQGMDLDTAIRHDIERRDFTINALLLSSNGVLHSHVRSFFDLQQRIIRAVSPSSLLDDPVRAFRACRFTATLQGFSIHDETLSQMRILPVQTLNEVSAERVGSEVLKALSGYEPGNFLRNLHAGSCFDPWFSEFSDSSSIPAGPVQHHHASSVLEHTASIMDKTAEYLKSVVLCTDKAVIQMAVWMAFCHDIGKNTTDKSLLPHHYGHEKRGELMATDLGQRLRLSGKLIKAGSLAARLHMKGGSYENLRPGTRVDLLMTLHSAHSIYPFLALLVADSGNTDLPEIITKDLNIITKVVLPERWRGKGASSGNKLRELRCMALANQQSVDF